ncbi:hypothetical protein [Stackebrandtia soli]|uniref:hypothetical protein n=1 Tax=Stackebrandtia soli TaxID=1892856 RepID=UPI0039EB6A8F
MAALTITTDSIVVTPGSKERVFGLTGPVTIPLTAVRSAEAVDAPIAETRGGRYGAHVPGLAKVGTWGLGKGVRQLVFAYQDRPGIHIRLNRELSENFDEIIVSTPNAADLVTELTARG